MEPRLQHRVIFESTHHQPHVLRRKSRTRQTRSKAARTTNEGHSFHNTAKRILSVSYDHSLLMTREMLLRDAGFGVTSAKSLPAALDFCRKNRFDLVIVGHSIPRKDKQEMLQTIKSLALVPVLSIRRHGEEPLHGADHSVDSHDGPTALLEAVNKVLRE